MATLKKNVDLVSPLGDSANESRKSSLKFLGYKGTGYTDGEIPSRVGQVVACHQGTSDDLKGKLTLMSNQDASSCGTVTHYSGYAVSHGDGDITLSGSYQGNTHVHDFTLYLQNNVGGYHSGVTHATTNLYSVSAIGWSGRTDEKTYQVYDWDTTTFFTVDIYEGIKATWTNSTFGVGIRYKIEYKINSSTLYSNGDFVSGGKIVSESQAFTPKVVASDGYTVLNTYS